MRTKLLWTLGLFLGFCFVGICNSQPGKGIKPYDKNPHYWQYKGESVLLLGATVFCRNIIGGFASSRFHRIPAGLGLYEITMNSIHTIRKIEEFVKFWDVNPRMDLIHVEDENVAYLSAKKGESYVIYFTTTGKAKIDLSRYSHSFSLNRINLKDAEWKQTQKSKRW
ncbi:MAG TPA: hypothetical protein VFD91_13850 [Mariniphaga sp.]|nr:hypothetical protein [Mariniphaga sp.]